MLRLIFAFVDIMLHRRGPESLPSSKFLFWSLLALSVVAEFVLLWLAARPGREFAVGLLVSGFDIWFVWALLRTFNRQARFRQTMTAIFGVEVLLTILQTPLARAVATAPPADPENPTLTLPAFIGFLLLVWAIDITAFVFARALERPYLLCIAIVLGYVLLIEALRATLLQPVI